MLEEEEKDLNSRVLLIDGLNLFFRNFSVMNMLNSKGDHIGGLGGTLRSLGSLIKMINPTSVYMVFDGIGSSQNRKNIIPAYKSNRNLTKITNWDIFQNVEEENDAKVDQIVRLIQYLQLLPIKILSMGKVEADDVIAILSDKLSKNPENQVFMVTNDRDYLQLLKKNCILYLPNKKEFYTPDTITRDHGIMPENFLIYKTLMGDTSDKLDGVKGLGPKKLLKLFPELATKVVTIEDIFEISASKMTLDVIYARVIQARDMLTKSYKIMDLSNPMIDEDDQQLLEDLIYTPTQEYRPKEFLQMYEEDQIGKIVRNVDRWLQENFEPLSKFSILQ